MAIIKCSECGGEVSDKANSCPKCGNRINTAGKSFGKVLLWLAGGFVAFLAFGAVLRANDPNTDAKDKAKAVLELCRREQNDELKSIAERRFIRGACDMKRDEYIQKYGYNPE